MQDLIAKETMLTGTEINYFIVCPVKLWYFSRGISMEQTSDLVAVGKFIHENSYQKNKKEILIDSKIGIDFIKKGSEIVLHEVKKSKKLENAHYFQLLYYIYYLKRIKGVESVSGVIDYPEQRETKKVELTENREKDLKDIIEKTRQTVALPHPPDPEKKAYCRKCSYFEFCRV